MAYRYRWLDQALDDLGEEIGYVRNKFGKNAARKAESKSELVLNSYAFFQT
jgi:plasmid stabilization system protein ParE